MITVFLTASSFLEIPSIQIHSKTKWVKYWQKDIVCFDIDHLLESIAIIHTNILIIKISFSTKISDYLRKVLYFLFQFDIMIEPLLTKSKKLLKNIKCVAIFYEKSIY